MKILISFLILAVANIWCQKELTKYNEVKAKDLPFQVIIYNLNQKSTGLGALISPTCVITLANLVIRGKEFIVVLGASQTPLSQKFSGTQTIKANKILIHEDFGIVIATKQFIYDIGLIFFNEPVELTDTVQLVKLPLQNLFPLTAGLFANVTAFGFQHKPSGHPAYATVQIRNQEKCELFFGEKLFLKSEEICLRQKKLDDATKKLFMSLALVIDDQLVGLGRTRLVPAICQVTSRSCDSFQVFTSIENSLDWIYENVQDLPKIKLELTTELPSSSAATIAKENDNLKTTPSHQNGKTSETNGKQKKKSISFWNF